MEATLLCDSFLCRLCGEENKNGTDLFPTTQETTTTTSQQNLVDLVNRYLPVKVEENSEYPRTICPGCAIQLEATKQFLDLVIIGQAHLRELLRHQRQTLNRQEKQRFQLEEALRSVNPNSSVETYTIHSDETGEKYLIQIFSEGPLFGPEHEQSLRAEGLERPRKKRGRPPKQPQQEKPPPEEIQPPLLEELNVPIIKEDTSASIDEENEDFNNEEGGRKRRRIRVPTRYLEAVQGKELDQIFKEEGVLDDDEINDGLGNSSYEGDGSQLEGVIGRMKSRDGEDLGELIAPIKPKSRPVRKFQCNSCCRNFLTRSKLVQHIATVHDKDEDEETETVKPDIQIVDGQIKEEQLNETATTEVNDTDNDDGTIKTEQTKTHHCKECQKEFSCKQNYEVHFRAVHEGERPFACEECGRKFSYANSLRLHMVRHKYESEGVRQYQCGVCDKFFRHPSSLLYHRDAEHGDGRKFVCGKCGKTFKHRQLLQRHQLVHSEERPHQCTHCSAAFKTRANLLNHGAVHGGAAARRYHCNEDGCGRSFAHRTSLTLHVRTHLGVKPYRCDLCPKEFSQKGNLLEHRRIHTGEKPYQCDECGRAFTTSSQFRLHLKRHSGERPFRCEHCHKSFLNRDTWKCHVRRHLDERPFRCRQCPRAFAESWALKKHQRMHTGERPYQCEQCSRTFADSSNLVKHRRTHKNNNLGNNTQLKFLQQLVDEQGQPISLSTAEGQQIRVVSAGDIVQGLLPDGTLLPIDLTPIQQQRDGLIPVGGEESVVDMAQFLEGESPESGVCLLTSYDVDDPFTLSIT